VQLEPRNVAIIGKAEKESIRVDAEREVRVLASREHGMQVVNTPQLYNFSHSK
jgi:hypothetical protein